MAARDDVVMEPRVFRLHARALIEIHLVCDCTVRLFLPHATADRSAIASVMPVIKMSHDGCCKCSIFTWIWCLTAQVGYLIALVEFCLSVPAHLLLLFFITPDTGSMRHDVTKSLTTTRSPFCGYNFTQCVEIMGEDLPNNANRI